ncbi:hypothetical protein ACFRQM_48230 [Streptomyces sp. NPDC056831]|uniref:hypothetical protein n=1 Tax=Streptomyces sp. NPDC056831 TaxID=3345954 RepID=UPI00367E51BF
MRLRLPSWMGQEEQSVAGFILKARSLTMKAAFGEPGFGDEVRRSRRDSTTREGQSVAKDSALRGYLLEESLAWLLRFSGYRLLVHEDQDPVELVARHAALAG